jgi:hypothetical protein
MLDFALPDGSFGGQVWTWLVPGAGRGCYFAGLVGVGRLPVVVWAEDLAVPRGGLEIRAEGLWADYVVEEAFDHVSVGLEAFGLEVDAGVAVSADVRGDRVPLGFDLGWETDGPVRPLGGQAGDGGEDKGDGATGYAVPCQVVGEILVGDERIELDAHGWRHHLWGPLDSGPSRWPSTRGRLDDGSWFGPGPGPGPGDGVGVDAEPRPPVPLPAIHPAGDPLLPSVPPEALARVRARTTGQLGTAWVPATSTRG